MTTHASIFPEKILVRVVDAELVVIDLDDTATILPGSLPRPVHAAFIRSMAFLAYLHYWARDESYPMELPKSEAWQHDELDMEIPF